MTSTADIEAQVTFLTVEEGGRPTPLSTGYRGDVFFRDEYHVTVHEYPDVESVRPGQTVKAFLRFLHPRSLYPHLAAHEEFEIREGHRTVARGRVIRVLDLATHAANEKP